MAVSTVKISGMSCQHCVMAVKKAIEAIAGVSRADVEVGTAKVEFDDSKVGIADIEQAIVKAGYKIAA